MSLWSIYKNKMKDEEKQIIKELYKDFIEIAKLNNPDYYMMSIVFYDSIISRVQTIESELKRLQKARDTWMNRAGKAEAELKSLKMDKAKPGVRK